MTMKKTKRKKYFAIKLFYIMSYRILPKVGTKGWVNKSYLKYKKKKKRTYKWQLETQYVHVAVLVQSPSHVLFFCDPMELTSPPRFLCHDRDSWQECWSGLPFSPQGIFPIQGLEPGFLKLLRIWFISLVPDPIANVGLAKKFVQCSITSYGKTQMNSLSNPCLYCNKF